MIDKASFRSKALELAQKGEVAPGARLADLFGISRASASARLRTMARQGLIVAEGATRSRRYRLAALRQTAAAYRTEGLSEEWVWRELVLPIVTGLPENVFDIWQYGVTEIVNNAIDHSGSPYVEIHVTRTALDTTCSIIDKGEGIFRKIQRALGLYDPRDALIELAKGKFTTDPENHTGEGIFFSSKVFDLFQIRSGGLVFAHAGGDQGIMLESDPQDQGTMVVMELRNDSGRTLKEVMDQFAAPEAYSFSKTIVPIRLATHEGEKLVSRSQAKRISFRFERFENVILDFNGVEEIGQAFADELFRVFQNAHPKTILAPIHMSPRVKAMVDRARYL